MSFQDQLEASVQAAIAQKLEELRRAHERNQAAVVQPAPEQGVSQVEVAQPTPEPGVVQQGASSSVPSEAQPQEKETEATPAAEASTPPAHANVRTPEPMASSERVQHTPGSLGTSDKFLEDLRATEAPRSLSPRPLEGGRSSEATSSSQPEGTSHKRKRPMADLGDSTEVTIHLLDEEEE